MASKKIAELTVGEKVTATYAVRDKSLAPFKSKPGQYLSLTLGDATGEISARMWDNAEEAAALFQTGDAILVRAKVEEYRGQKQLVIEKLKKAEQDAHQKAELLPQSPRDLDALRGQLLESVAEVKEPHLHAVLGCITRTWAGCWSIRWASCKSWRRSPRYTRSWTGTC